jgi:hypothetical protein
MAERLKPTDKTLTKKEKARLFSDVNKNESNHKKLGPRDGKKLKIRSKPNF